LQRRESADRANGQLDIARLQAKLLGMTEPVAVRLTPDALYERKVRLAKTIVLWLACFVAVTLLVACVFGVYNYATDRPAKELFLDAER
jgi:hypothetical protein